LFAARIRCSPLPLDLVTHNAHRIELAGEAFENGECPNHRLDLAIKAKDYHTDPQRRDTGLPASDRNPAGFVGNLHYGASGQSSS